uniref:Kinesin-like protein n=1 Tax=Marsilea vestita TaxID=59764 RepID=A0A142KW86_MARVE|nr:armadillo repeat-containing kinesin b [Marsilea vestita]
MSYRNGSTRAMPKFERPLSVNSSSALKISLPSPPSSSPAPVRPGKTASPSPAPRRNSSTPQRNARHSNNCHNNHNHDSSVSGRVRVAVRMRPRNSEEMLADADFADCVELQPELKRLKLRKNNWDCETYEFDEILTEFSSQKRVYEVVAKPVVESVLEGYNGTVMAYGQTGTGKTFTLGRLGEEDASDRGIMVRAMEDILADVSPESDMVTVSYLQLYMETVQDLLAPERDNIPIVEDPKTGDVSLPGATLVEIRDQSSFLDLLQLGEANRFAANTKLNTESSRSHAILMVNVKKHLKGKTGDMIVMDENGMTMQMAKGFRAPTVRKSKLVVVDLAGSERLDKSGSEGHTLEEAKSINLSLTALGKCINALAEGSSHVPIRDSKLTRLLRDSFGGTARTSLVITIGPSPRHRGETASTILFGQRAMKVENMVKLKEEFDYKSLCRRLEMELEKLIQENERQGKIMLEKETKLQVRLEEAWNCASDAEKKLSIVHEKMASERSKLDKERMEVLRIVESERIERQRVENDLRATIRDMQHQKDVSDPSKQLHDEILELKLQLETESQLRLQAEKELRSLRSTDNGRKEDHEKCTQSQEVTLLSRRLEDETKQRKKLEEEIKQLRTQLQQMNIEAEEAKKQSDKSNPLRLSFGSDGQKNALNTSHNSENGHRAPNGKTHEHAGLQKVLSLLESEDVDIRVHAVKVVANLAAEEANQQKIVEAGGLHSMLMLLNCSEDETIRRVAAGAIANLAMNETNQELIMSLGGIGLLSKTADDAEDPQTLRMVAGAIANLCGNDKLQLKLRDEGGIRALLSMVKSRHPDVLAQVARGIANFAKCESRGAAQGSKTGRSLLIDEGALPWIVANANNEASPIRRHIELALCHLAQQDVNGKDLVAGGALWELVRISKECSREDIRLLAHRMLSQSPTFQTELRRS